MSERTGVEVAIIGMACRFPGADDPATFWKNLCAGVESITVFSDDELEALGIAQELIRDPHYVKANAILRDVALFDAAFFGYSPREAELMDPQQRIFLECAWEALEHAGYDPQRYAGAVGVYAGTGINHYLLRHLAMRQDLLASSGEFQTFIGNDKDFLTTRVSYNLNLKGPSVTVQSACSTSAVALHLAWQSLIGGGCDIALAGGVSLPTLQPAGYLYEPGGIVSPDGHCRAYDAESQGSLFGSGSGVVVLKRLDDALDDGDTIYAVIRGAAINNDGSTKVGFTAPSVDGQAEVIRMAQVVAEVEPESISYIEGHGTATPLGDPIEVAALNQVFRAGTDKTGFCALGSVKTNIGHLDVAAGVAGLIKTALALKHGQIPPSLHFRQANPALGLETSPFFVPTELMRWPTTGQPRRAGVSSFGIGGTNAHLVLEEAPEPEPTTPGAAWQVLILSAKTSTALEAATDRLADHLAQHPDCDLADVAYTLQIGRAAFDYRRVVVAQDVASAQRALATRDPAWSWTGAVGDTTRPSVAFLLPGVGDQYVQMAAGLYQQEPVFRSHVDQCCDLMLPLLGQDLRQILFAGNLSAPISKQTIDLRRMIRRPGSSDSSDLPLHQTIFAQPAMFVIEYALARLWEHWGVQPSMMLGYSLGEYVAACLAGVFSVEDALRLVVGRARMIQESPPGAMLAVPLAASEVEPMLRREDARELTLAARNGPGLTVVSGDREAIDELEQCLRTAGVAAQRLATEHAFHSSLLAPLVNAVTALVTDLTLEAPQRAYISNVTGTWVTSDQALDPAYWGLHMCRTVNFEAGLATLWEAQPDVLLELGPGQTLITLAHQHPARKLEHDYLALSALRPAYDHSPDQAVLMAALGRLWLGGVPIDWSAVREHERRRRVPLPTYPFEQQRYWVAAPANAPIAPASPTVKQAKIEDWFYLPSWKQAAQPMAGRKRRISIDPALWLVFADDTGLGAQLVQRLRGAGHTVVQVSSGQSFAQIDRLTYTLNPQHSDEYTALFQTLQSAQLAPQKIAHLWSLLEVPVEEDSQLAKGLYSLLFLGQALNHALLTEPLALNVVSNHLFDIESGDRLVPTQAMLLAPCKVLPQEAPHIRCRVTDVALPVAAPAALERLAKQLVTEFDGPSDELAVAYRGKQRWVQSYEPLPIMGDPATPDRLRWQGVYLITGGLGRVGRVLATYLAESSQARLVLTTRAEFPTREAWEQWLATYEAEDRTSSAIRWLQELEQMGARVLVVRADVADVEQMQAALDHTRAQFGALHGVIHAAGIMDRDAFTVIADTGYAECERHFRPKVAGLRTLSAVLRPYPLDFCMLTSSLSPVLGGIGLAAYAAANLFMDAFARQQHAADAGRWISVNWADWQLSEEQRTAGGLGATVANLNITPHEGVETFRRVLALDDLPQIVISSGDLGARIRQWVTFDDPATGSAVPAPTHEVLPSIRRRAYVAPRTAAERAVADACQELLGIAPIGSDDNFFELGGNSLLGIQLISRLRKQFQTSASLADIFEQPTVAGIAEALAGAPAVEQEQPIQRRPADIPVPISFAQERLWLADQFAADRAAYNIPSAVRFSGPLDLSVLEATYSEIVRRHEVLRTTFTNVNGRQIATIHPPQPQTIAAVDLQALAPDERQAAVERLIRVEVERPFEISTGPLVRVSALRLAAEEYIVVLIMHHIVSDGWSTGVLIRELVTIYSLLVVEGSQGVPLPELPIQYADYAYWQRQQRQSERIASHLAYWTKQLEDAPALLTLPWDRPRPNTPSQRGGHLRFTLSPELTDKLKDLSRQEGASLFMAALAAYQILLARLSGQLDLVVGVDHANRQAVETRDLLGFFVNMLPLRIILSKQQTFRALLHQVRTLTLAAYEHHEVPFEKIVDALRLKRSRSYTPVFQAVLTFQNAPTAPLDLPGLRAELLPVSSERVKFDLVLFMEAAAGGLSCTFDYSVDLFDASTIERMAQTLRELLQTIVDQPDIVLDTLLPDPGDNSPRGKQQRREAQLQRLQSVKRRSLGTGEA